MSQVTVGADFGTFVEGAAITGPAVWCPTVAVPTGTPVVGAAIFPRTDPAALVWRFP